MSQYAWCWEMKAGLPAGQASILLSARTTISSYLKSCRALRDFGTTFHSGQKGRSYPDSLAEAAAKGKGCDWSKQTALIGSTAGGAGRGACVTKAPKERFLSGGLFALAFSSVG